MGGPALTMSTVTPARVPRASTESTVKTTSTSALRGEQGGPGHQQLTGSGGWGEDVTSKQLTGEGRRGGSSPAQQLTGKTGGER